jgi:hypothetical protein
MTRLRAIVVHPFLFALFPVLSQYVHNWGKLPIRELWDALAVAVILTLVVWLLTGLLVRNWRKAAAVTSLSVFAFFSYGYLLRIFLIAVYDVGLFGRSDLVGKAIVGVALFAAIVLLGFWAIVRSKGDTLTLGAVLNVMSIALVLSVAANWVRVSAGRGRTGSYIRSWKEGLSLDELLVQGAGASRALPDVYYILLDGYAGADVLKEVYQIDNAGFLSYLDRRGFYVAEESRSNYAQTVLSVASSLNFMYLDEVAEQVGVESNDRLPLKATIDHSRLVRALRSHGYTFSSFSTGYSLTEIRSADTYLSAGWTPSTFLTQVMENTPLAILLAPFSPTTPYDYHRNRVLYALEHLADAAENDSPDFVFAHIIAPHPPFVFGPNGEHIRSSAKYTLVEGDQFPGTRSEYLAGYRDQLVYVTARIEGVIDEILSRSPEPPIIILQADHGPSSLLDWSDMENSNLRERMSILNAYYFPGGDYGLLYPDITPVNTFRVVLNQYFGADYPLLEDKSLFSTLTTPYRFNDVDDLRGSEPGASEEPR